MQNPVSSPGDPLFYLHHTWLDKVWWDWQNLNISSRLYDISGRNVQDPRLPFPGAPGNGTGFPFPFPPGNGSGFPSFPPLPPRSLSKRDGDPGNVTTLDHVLNMMGIIPNATIRDVMDTRSGPLCYEYVQPEIDLL
jgi:tyrosinase